MKAKTKTRIYTIDNIEQIEGVIYQEPTIGTELVPYIELHIVAHDQYGNPLHPNKSIITHHQN